MKNHDTPRVAIVCPGTPLTRRTATLAQSRFSDLAGALAQAKVHVELAPYHDDCRADVRAQLMQADAVLVWSNPVEDGRARTTLNGLLSELAASGVFVSAHPEVIRKLGTKEVLYRTRDIGWGCDTKLHADMTRLREALPGELACGEARVLKQLRASGGDGVWKVQLQTGAGARVPGDDAVVRVRHARRGCGDEYMTMGAFIELCEPYFRAGAGMIDQAYQERLVDGTVRCYLVHDRVVGFGEQAINALYPAPPGRSAGEAPQPGPRLYHPPTLAAFQHLKRRVERDWVPAAQRLLDIETEALPVIWDCDFLLGPEDDDGNDTYVLCEINVSSVAPYPPSAVPFVVDATVARARAAMARRAGRVARHS